MKKDIVTLTGLTAVDGSVVSAGAHISLEIEFPSLFDGYVARVSFFRNKQIFENGYEPVRIKDFEDEFRKLSTEDVNVSTIYTETVAFINDQFDSPICEIVN